MICLNVRGKNYMSINKIENTIDKAFEDFYEQLEENNFGLWIDPSFNELDDEIKVVEEEQEIKELMFD